MRVEKILLLVASLFVAGPASADMAVMSVTQNGDLSVTGGSVTASGFFGDGAGITNVAASTQAYPNGTTTQSSNLGPCIANSTATIKLNQADRILVCYSGSMGQTTAPTNNFLGILLDGAFLPGYSSTRGQTACIIGNISAANQVDCSFCLITPIQSPGNHSVCLAAATNTGGTIQIPGTDSVVNSAAQLSLVEVP